MTRRWAGLALAAILILLGARASHAEGKLVRVGVNGVISDGPLFIAERKGYFAQQGIAVKFVAFDSGPKMVAPLGAGQLEVGAGAASAGLFNAAARGIGVKIVADKGSTTPTYSYMPLLIRKDLVDQGKVRTYADLKGLKLAEAGRGGSPGSTLNEALKRGGLAYGDVQHVHNLGYPQQVVALANGAIDGAITTEPSVTQAVEKGVAMRFSGPDLYPNQQIAVLLYGADFAKNEPDLAAKFMVAYLRGVRFFDEAITGGRFAGPNAAEVIDILVQDTSTKDKALYKSMIANGCDPDGFVNVASLEKDLAFYKAQGYIEGEGAGVGDLVDHRFVERALESIGRFERKP
ncbi:MAG TPA: ABC transporter substrate-binding protein [Stellaceae bacterium]